MDSNNEDCPGCKYKSSRTIDSNLAALSTHPFTQDAKAGSIRMHCTSYLFDEIHEASTKPPGFMPMALEGVDSHLWSPLVAHGDNVDSIVQQGSICLK